MASRRAFLESLIDPTPELPDTEDPEYAEGMWSRRSKNAAVNEEYDEVDELPSRRRFVAPLDETYEGKKVSAKEVFHEEEGFSGLAGGALLDDNRRRQSRNDSPGDDDEDVDDEGSEGEGGSDSDEGSLAAHDNKSDVDELQSDVNGDEEGNEVHDDAVLKVEEALAKVDIESQRRKGVSVRTQLTVGDWLMHMQIKMHAALRAFSCLPRGEAASQLLRSADENIVHNYKLARKNVLNLIETLLQIEDALLTSSTQTVDIAKGKAKADEEDEEIESSADEKEESGSEPDVVSLPDEDASDEELESDEDAEDAKESDAEEECDSSKGRQRSLRSLRLIEGQLSKRHQRFEAFRNSSLSKWDERTRLSAFTMKKSAKKDFGGFESAMLKQINQIMSEKHRLIRRSQLKRSDAERIGGNPEATHDVEIYDDDDFYQQLLKDLIERRSAQVVDPVEMSRQWLEIQKLRQKRSKKKKVDTKASKGRKVRFTVIPKLINFFPSQPETVRWSHESRNELFQSLFAR